MTLLTKFPFLSTFIFAFSANVSFAQFDDLPPPPKPTPAPVRVVGTMNDETGSTVRGRVYYQNTGKPVRHGWVGLLKIKDLVPQPVDPAKATGAGVSITTESYLERLTLTDDNGEFSIKFIKSGVYHPIVRVAGILNPTRFDKENPEFQQFAIDGLSETRIDIGVRRGASISGRVTYSDGEPIIGAMVQIVPKTDELNAGDFGTRLLVVDLKQITDDQGHYRFSGLPAAEYFVVVTELASHGGTESGVASYNIRSIGLDSGLKTYYPDSQAFKDASTVSAGLGYETSGINITVPERRLFEISGRVVSRSTGAPIEKVAISFKRIENGQVRYSYFEQSRTTTESDGNWNLKEMPAGKYRLTFSQDSSYSYRGNNPKSEKPVKYVSVFRDIEITNEGISNIDVELGIEATVSGTVMIEGNLPFPDSVSIGAVDYEQEIGKSARISDEVRKGSQGGPLLQKEFEIAGLTEGKYLITAESKDFSVKSIRLGNMDLLTTPLTIKSADNIKGVQIVLSADVGTLRGKIKKPVEGRILFAVMIEKGKPLTIAMISSRSARIGDDGTFELKAAPGEYYVFVAGRFAPEESESIEELFTRQIKNAQTITLKSKETQTIVLDSPE